MAEDDKTTKDEKKPEGAGKCGMDAFNVLKLSNEGVKMPLTLPDGTKTEEFLMLRGADSKYFQNAKARANREMVKLAKNQKAEPEDKARREKEITCRLASALVCSWSFDVECDETNIMKFFKDSPQVQEQADMFAGTRTNFFKKPPQN